MNPTSITLQTHCQYFKIEKQKARYFALTGFSTYGAELGFEPYIGTLQTISLKVRIQKQKSPLLLAGSFDKYGGEIGI
ncbi:hypothetical protein [Shewanella sp. 10N.286.52.A9]|uniref:hypothetical protein n=1 Tax=Shewanella sp. 10N.286.52.A9 TaxID=3229711 RepID=UPI00354B9C3E